jgi:hypothetical protein
MSELAADQAEVRRQALMMEGRAFMPAESMAMTKGEEAAVPSLSLRRGLLEATNKPMMNTPWCTSQNRMSLRFIAEE